MSKVVYAIRHVPHEGLAAIADALAARELRFEHRNVWQDPTQPDWDRAAGLIVMGGPMNVDQIQRYPFLAREIDWIEHALAEQLPVLGVCLGAQLLAKAAGGRVYPAPVKEIGWDRVTLTQDAGCDTLLAAAPPEPTVFQWHGDTYELPPGGVQLARGKRVEQQAFRVGRTAYGLQFHLEMTADLLESWLTEPSMCAELAAHPGGDTETLRRQAAHRMAEMQQFAGPVLAGFAGLCAARGR